MSNPRLLPAIPTPPPPPLAGFTLMGAKQILTPKPAISGKMLYNIDARSNKIEPSPLLENITSPDC